MKLSSCSFRRQVNLCVRIGERAKGNKVLGACMQMQRAARPPGLHGFDRCLGARSLHFLVSDREVLLPLSIVRILRRSTRLLCICHFFLRYMHVKLSPYAALPRHNHHESKARKIGEMKCMHVHA